MKKQIKQISKKSLSLLLAVVMIMTSMSVCFGTISFAAATGASDAEWNALATALQTNAVKNASFSGNKYNKTVADPDGDLIAAIDAWWTVFNKVKENVGNDSQNNSFRTAPQVNSAIASKLQSLMGGNYTTYNVASFLSGCIAGVGDTDIQSGVSSSAENKDANSIANPLGAAKDIVLAVNLAGILSYDSVDDLPDGDMATTKTYTIKHRNSNYYQTQETREETTGSGCNATTQNVTYYKRHFYYVIDSTSAVEGNYQSTSVLKTSKATLDANSKYLNATLDEMIGYINADEAAVAAARTAVNTAKTNVDNFNPNAWAKYFTAYDVAGLNSNIDLATKIIALAEVCINLYELYDAGYEHMELEQLYTLTGKLKEGLNTFDAADQNVRDYITSHEYEGRYFVRSEIQSFKDAVDLRIALYELIALKETIDTTTAPYYDYNEDDVLAGTLGGATLSTAKGTVDGFKSSINSYLPQYAEYVDMVMPGYVDKLTTLSSDLAYFIKTANYNDQFSAQYAKYIAEIYSATDPNASSEDLVASLKGNAGEGIQGYDAWYSGLKTLLNGIAADLEEGTADKILEENDIAMKARMDAVYTTLYGRVLAQIDNATELYAIVAALNGKIDILNMDNYAKYKIAFEDIDRDTYNYLKDEARNFSMPQTTINKYNALKDDFTIYNDFVASGGFNSFKTLLGEYVNREVLANDLVRDEEYVVDSDKVAQVIASLDTLITSEEIGGLLGSLLGGEAEEGEEAAFDLGTMLKDLIADMLFSDAFINTVVQMLNPILIDALANIWLNDLPSEVSALGQTIKVNYAKPLKTVVNDVGLYIFPDLLASRLDKTKYADTISKLNAAVSNFNSDFGVTNSADQDKYYTYYYDDVEGKYKMDKSVWDSPRLLDEEGKLTLTWGVDAAKEAGKTGDELAQIFYNAFDDAMDGIRPLLVTLFANQAFSGTSEKVANVNFLGTKQVKLSITATGNKGFANLIVPLFEALDVPFTAVSTVEGTHSKDANSVAKILEDIIGPIFTLCDEIGAAPLDKIISILPNLCYALLMQSLPKLLGMLQTQIDYKASVDIGCDYDAASDSIPINVGEMLNINDLIDLRGGINALLSMLGLPLPAIDQGKIAQMGKLTQRSTQRSAYTYTGASSGQAYFIEADKGAVGNYLLQYIFGILEDEEAFKGLLGMLMTVEQEDGTKVPDEAKIEETIASFDEIGLFKYGKNNAIAAVVELFNMEGFSFGDYVWYDGAVWEGSTVTNLTPAMKAYLSYDNDLTKEKAQYIIENIEEIISSVMAMINGDEAEAFSLATMLGDLIGGLFTNETITALAKGLSVIDINALLAGGEEAEGEASEPETVAEGEEAEEAAAIDINALITDLLGIDLTPFAAYKDLADDTDWGVTDGATFAAALADVLAPFGPVIDFIFKGEDLKIIYDAAQPAITLKGYNGYDSAIVPLLEALGVDAPAMGADDDALVVILNAVLDLLDTVIGTDAEGNPVNAVDGILNIIPGLLYFIQSDGLTTAVNNLLIPVYQLIDAIRPIYELNLNELLGSLLAESGISINFNSLVLDFDFIFSLVESLAGLDLSDLQQLIADVCKVAVVPYTSESSVIGANGKKGAYTEYFDSTDLVAVVLSFLLDWCRDEANVDQLAGVIGGEDAELTATVKDYITKIYTLIEGIDPDYGTIDWAAIWPDGYDAENVIFSSGISVTPTIESLNYPTDWTEDSAKYLDENLDALLAAAFKLAGVEGTLSDMLKSEINFLTGENLNKLAALLVDLIGKLENELLDPQLVDAIGVLIGADLTALKAYHADEEKEYTTVEFAKELAKILGTIPEVVNLVFFADDFTLFNKADGSAAVTIKGAYGYAYGLAYILEALGCKDLPAKDSKDVEGVLVSIAERFDEIIADPINEILNVLPNVLYFINSNGVGVAAKNILSSVTGFMSLLKDSFGVDVDLVKIINDAINGLIPEESDFEIDLLNLDLEAVFGLVQEILGLDLSAAADILVDFCVGKINPYQSVSGEYGFKMEYDDNYARYDMITILVTVALLVVANEDNAAALDEMIGTDIMSGLKTVFASSPVGYISPDWDYCWDANGEATGETIPVIESAITYPNDWEEEDAEYLAENLPALVDAVVALVSENESLAELLQANVNVFTGETLQSLVDLITNLLTDVDDVLLGLGIILNVDIKGLKSYTVPEGIDTTAEFAAELANILNTYAAGVAEWLFFGKDYTFFVDETKMEEGVPYDKEKAIITLNGAYGYAEGLALLLEALGCENLPEFYDVEKLDTAAAIEDVLNSLAARIDEIFANPVGEALELLPNLLYFLNANGVAVAVTNIAGAFTGLATRLQAFGLDISLNSLVNIEKLCGIDKDLAIGLDNLTLAAILELVSELTGLNLAVLEDVLVGFAMGKVEEYDSVSAEKAYKMSYKDEFDKHDMITLLVTAVLLVAVEDEENAAALNEMLGTEIVTALKDVFAASEITYTAPDWNYPLADNGTVDAMKYSITYPNNWTEETAQYVTEKLPEIGDMIAGMVDSKYTSLAALLQDKVNIFTADTLDSLVALIADLLGDIDDGLLEAAGLLLNVDVVGLKSYKAPAINSTEEFAAELANVLNTYAPGIVEWLLLGRDYKFFVKDAANGVPVDAITITGAYGYAEGLALLLEALGCKNLPDAYAENITSEEIVEGTLASLAARIDAVLADPVVEVLAMLPNLLYFLNTNGVAAVIDNLTAALTALLDKLAAFGLEVDLNELVNLQKLMGIEGKGANIDLDNLTIADLLEAVSLMVEGLDLTLVEDVLVGFALGKVEAYDSVSKECGETKKMLYADEFDTYDMVTVLANLAVLTLTDDANAEFVKGLVGEDIYLVILALLDMEEYEIKEFNWQFTDKADTGYVFSAISASDFYGGEVYGDIYTEEMAQYIADNFGEFVDNIVYLLGININGQSVDNLKELLNGLVNGSLYNSENIVAIRDALAGVLAGVINLEVNGANVGKYIAAVLEKAGIADIEAVANVEVAEFTENREMFVTALCDVLEPLYGVLRYVLADEDIAFFVNLEKTDAITLKGAEGYAYGIIPLLETLDCEDILTPDEYYAAIEADGDVLLTAFLNPLLDRVDVILNNPADEILDMLPNLIYFINSNGVDTVVKNTLNAVYGLLEAIKPIAKIDLYELIGLDLSTLTFEKIFDMLLDMIAESTGYEFSTLDASAIVELSVGTLESYTSKNGKTAYRMVYASTDEVEGGKTEMVTVVERLLLTFIMHENNQEMLIGLLKDNLGMTADGEKYMRALLKLVADCALDTKLGMETALATLYYIYYGADIGVGESANGLKDLNAEWTKLLAEMRNSKDEGEVIAGEIIAGILGLDIFEDVIDPDEGIAPNGLIAFFQKIIAFFQSIGDWFRSIFNK